MVIAWIWSGASLTESQKSQSFLMLSPSCTAKETTPTTFAAAKKLSIASYRAREAFEIGISILASIFSCLSAPGVFDDDGSEAPIDACLFSLVRLTH